MAKALSDACDVVWEVGLILCVAGAVPDLEVVDVADDDDVLRDAAVIQKLAERQGVCVINSPRAIRDHNEKLAIGQFSDYTSPTMVTSDAARTFALGTR